MITFGKDIGIASITPAQTSIEHFKTIVKHLRRALDKADHRVVGIVCKIPIQIANAVRAGHGDEL